MGDVDRTPALLDDIRRLADDAKRIIDRGEEAFFDPADRTQRLAAKAIVIDLNTAVAQLPATTLAEHPDAAWDELRAMRNYLAHDYANTDYRILWNALAREIPALAEQLGLR